MAEDQGEAIAFLSRPESYGPGIATVERIDTHAAIVFLAGERAYKLKRAVRYAYLDYSSLSRRHQSCQAELALNRRTAPQLYLGIRSLNRTADGRLAFDADGPAVDYVVEMGRFDQADLLDRMAARGALTVPIMLDLAGEIARFHGRASPVYDMGGSRGIAEVLDSNARSFAETSPAILDPAATAAVDSGCRAALHRHADLLEERRRDGRVRHCHGDLHLRNVCLIEGRPTLFDCVEFSRSLACIDLLYDLAFLLMDLCHRRLGPLANALFNRYLDLTDESGGLAVLPLFLSVRAAIRAHVDAVAADRQAAAETRRALVEAARSYLTLAQRLLDPAPPALVAVAGLSGTGKSTLAYGLAPELGAPPGARVLRSDVIRKRMMKVALTTPLPESAYTREVSDAVYRALRREAESALAAGHSVVVDGVFADEGERIAMAALARAAGTPFRGFWLEAPPEVLVSRIAARRGDASDATPAVLHRQLAFDIGPVDWIRIDAAVDPQACLAEARRSLANLRAADARS